MTMLGSCAIRLLAVGLAAGLLFGPARADDATDRQVAALEILDQLHSADMVSGILPNILAQIRTNLTHNDPDLVKEFDAYAPHLTSVAEATRPMLVGKLADVYARTFTLDELKDMLAYYKSPVGQRIIATQAEINHNMLVVARDWGTAVAQTMAKDAAAELQGAKPADPPASPPP